MADKFVLNVLSFLMISSDEILKSFSIVNEYSVNFKYIVYDHYRAVQWHCAKRIEAHFWAETEKHPAIFVRLQIELGDWL